MRTRTTRPVFAHALAVLMGAAVLTAATPEPASAGPLRFLFGGGDGHDLAMQDRSSRQRVSFPADYAPGTIVVSFADRHLYYVTRPGEALRYLIGTPKGEARWSGESRVSEKRVNPRWIPTADMRAEDPSLPLEVPGGHPRNPLGVRALYLGDTLYRIHGTDAPQTVGKEVSHGCIRLYNTDIVDLYNRAAIGAPVIVTWKSFTGTVTAMPHPSDLRRADAGQETSPYAHTPWRTKVFEPGR